LDSVQSLHQLFADDAVELKLDMPDTVPIVHADRDRIQQVMINLLSNAIKFADAEAGQVVVTLRANPDHLRIDVADNGPGLDKAAREIIFDKFRQVADRRSGKPQGTGLGLPISRQIIAHFGGELWVESELDHGATFSFTLPCDVE
jgi:signal transduction histidine kinase